MLALLRLIVQEINDAGDLPETLSVLVSRVKKALEVDLCAVYRSSSDGLTMSLLAAEGVKEGVLGSPLGIHNSLVGWVCEKNKTLNLEKMQEHRRYPKDAPTGAAACQSFLGVPIVYRTKVLGVLLVQRLESKAFDEDYVAFLMTLAVQVAGTLHHSEQVVIHPERPEAQAKDIYFQGIAGSPGVVIGNAFVSFPHTDLSSVPDRTVSNIDEQESLFLSAIDRVVLEITNLKQMLGAHLPAEEAGLFDAYAMMLDSGSLVNETVSRIRKGNWAAGAWRSTIDEHVGLFGQMESVYLRERADDVLDLGQRVLKHVLNKNAVGKKHIPKNTVLVGQSVTASELAEMPTDRLAGLVSASGSNSSHVAILARALGIPAVMGVEGLPISHLDGKEVVINGYDGSLYLQPSGVVRAEFLTLYRQEKELSAGLLDAASEPANMLDGDHVPVLVNCGLMPEMWGEQTKIADGIGLYRTELPFMVRDHFPDESEQKSVYKEVLSSFSSSPVVLRTLDVGGDKALSYFPIDDENPFLGFRGIRISLENPEVFTTQLRAMLLANVGIGNLEILLPMIGSLQQFEEALMLLEHAKKELEEEGHDIPPVKVGVMIEVPAAVYIAQELAEQADFLSIGSNDLVQYLLAVDRNNSRVARLYDETSPAVIRALQQAIDGGHQAGNPVSVCGEMASDPALVLLLLGMGVDSLSVSLGSLPRVKWVIRSFSRAHARQIFRTALSLNESSAIRCLLERELVDAGLGALVRAGR